MSLMILRRIRKYKNRFRHTRRDWINGVNIPGATESLAAGTGTITFTQQSPNLDATLTITFTVDTTPGLVDVAIPARSSAIAVGDAVQAALNADAALTATDGNDGVVSVSATAGTLNALSIIPIKEDALAPTDVVPLAFSAEAPVPAPKKKSTRKKKA
jgi:hypothetical protein